VGPLAALHDPERLGAEGGRVPIITDITRLEQQVRYDCCVVGSGFAGLTIAMDLADRGHRVLLLEAGELDFSDRSQEVYHGEVIGDLYMDLAHARLRMFGGTSGHWQGWCRPLDEIDFQHKEAFPKAFWPIRKADLDPFLAPAMAMLEIEPAPADEEISGLGIEKVHFMLSPPVRFGEKYRDKVQNSGTLTCCLNANVFELQTSGNAIVGLTAVDYDGASVDVSARHFVLACGGIENSRILLHADARTNGQIVKNDGCLGKYWMEHPHFRIGSAVVFMTPDEERTFYALTADKQQELGLLNCNLRVDGRFSRKKTNELVKDMACVAPSLGEWAMRQLGHSFVCGMSVHAAWEQEPRPENRIALSKETADRFGVPHTVLHWSKSERDLDTVRKTALQYGEYLAQANIGRLKLDDWILGEGDYPEDDLLGGNHHMGGTRMGEGEGDGVVDRNLKVWGQNNLYVCGSSVFPAGGHANPTLTIVQLALRLSEHLAEHLAQKI
jgi:choline dehydrogenase-like flavoprotein